ncbi:MAG: hypothetical protein U5K32_11520 [Bacteroidales bacterium]|nr:hypothetical protein [Bacteroidales bacterium]
MKLLDLKSMHAFPYGERHKNELYKTDVFKVRIIELKTGEKLPPDGPCEMETYVIFHIVSGRIVINIDKEHAEAGEDQWVISEPGNYQMEALEDTKIMGIQIQKRE